MSCNSYYRSIYGVSARLFQYWYNIYFISVYQYIITTATFRSINIYFLKPGRTDLGWSMYIKDYVLSNHVGQNDYESHDGLESIKRYSLATHWFKTRGPTYLGKKESEASTVGEFLTYFPSAQSTIQIIVESLSEHLPPLPKGKTKREVKRIKVKKENWQVQL